MPAGWGNGWICLNMLFVSRKDFKTYTVIYLCFSLKKKKITKLLALSSLLLFVSKKLWWDIVPGSLWLLAWISSIVRRTQSMWPMSQQLLPSKCFQAFMSCQKVLVYYFWAPDNFYPYCCITWCQPCFERGFWESDRIFVVNLPSEVAVVTHLILNLCWIALAINKFKNSKLWRTFLCSLSWAFPFFSFFLLCFVGL